MNKINYIGKCLLIESSDGKKVKKILAVSDLHLGYEESLNYSGVLVTRTMYDELIEDFEEIFDKIAKDNKNLIDAKGGKAVNDNDISGVEVVNEKGNLINAKEGKVVNDSVVSGGEVVNEKGNLINAKGGKNVDYGIIAGVDGNSGRGVSGVNETSERSERVMNNQKIVDEIVLLGDLKHNFSGVLKQEWEDVLKLFDYLHGKCRRIIITKGNHDNYIMNIAGKRDFVEVVDYYYFDDVCFLHGDKKIEAVDEDNGKSIKTLVVGHMHPAIKLSDGVRKETYKCFLTGKYKKWKMIIAPSFFEYSQGTDIRNSDVNLTFPIDISKFEVGIVGENLKVLDFGKLGKIKN